MKEEKNQALIFSYDYDFLDAMSRYLEGDGFDVFLANNMQDALEQIRANNIERVIFDAKIPEKSVLGWFGELAVKL